MYSAKSHFTGGAGSAEGLAHTADVLSCDRTGESSVWRVCLRKPPGFSAAPGQYVLAAFPGQDPRPYSIASAPGREEIELHIDCSGEGRVAALVRAGGLSAGSRVGLSEATGAPFAGGPSAARRGGPLLVVAETMYVTPAFSITENFLSQGAETRPVLFVWAGERYLSEQKVRAQVRAAADDGRFLLFGELDAALRKIGDPAGCDVYLSGSKDMVKAAAEMLKAAGVPREVIEAGGRPAIVDEVYRSVSACGAGPVALFPRVAAASP